MSDQGTFDPEMCSDGIFAAGAIIASGTQEFVSFAWLLAKDLDTSPYALRRYLRSWYEGGRYACMDHGLDVSRCSTTTDVAHAFATIEHWGKQQELELFATTPSEADGEKAPATPDELRALMGLALTAPTPDAIMQFTGFANRMRGFGPFNVQMIYAQRPGAGRVATRPEWARLGRTVRAGAIPIVVLRPLGPIDYVFEELDTDPPIQRDPQANPFAAIGELHPDRLEKLIVKLGTPTNRKLIVRVHRPQTGANLAGWINGQPLSFTDVAPSAPAVERVEGDDEKAVWDVSVNYRLNPAEQFVTLLHELGHLFCGHVGPFKGANLKVEEFGWPDRRHVPHAAKEIEAELVAWWLANREGLTTGSPVYLRPYLEQAGAEVSHVDLDRVTRAVARVRGYLGGYP